MNNKSQQIQSTSNFEDKDVNNKKVTVTTTTNNNIDNDGDDNNRTVLARHIFHANIKQTLTRWIRETPV